MLCDPGQVPPFSEQPLLISLMETILPPTPPRPMGYGEGWTGRAIGTVVLRLLL